MQASIEELLARYRRPVTFLEISDDHNNCYSTTNATRFNGVYVFLCTGSHKVDHLRKKVNDQYNNIIILNPQEFSTTSLVQLAMCEHFDVTYVHNWSALYKNPYLISALLMLGDYLVIEVPQGFTDAYIPEDQKNAIIWRQNLLGKKERVCFRQHKTYLNQARWCMSAQNRAEQPSYTIVSTFEEKKMIKGHAKKVSEWIPGINLVTCVMLNLVYPTNDILRDNIERFLSVYHNDPVIGNMIIQGNQVQLIDFADARRNAQQEKCIRAALKLFTWAHRPKDPFKALQKYADYVHK